MKDLMFLQVWDMLLLQVPLRASVFRWCAVCNSSLQCLHLCIVLAQSPSTMLSAQTAPPTRLSLTGTEKSKHPYIILHTWPHWRWRYITVQLLFLYSGFMVINNFNPTEILYIALWRPFDGSVASELLLSNKWLEALWKIPVLLCQIATKCCPGNCQTSWNNNKLFWQKTGLFWIVSTLFIFKMTQPWPLADQNGRCPLSSQPLSIKDLAATVHILHPKGRSGALRAIPCAAVFFGGVEHAAATSKPAWSAPINQWQHRRL